MFFKFQDIRKLPILLNFLSTVLRPSIGSFLINMPCVLEYIFFTYWYNCILAAVYTISLSLVLYSFSRMCLDVDPLSLSLNSPSLYLCPFLSVLYFYLYFSYHICPTPHLLTNVPLFLILLGIHDLLELVPFSNSRKSSVIFRPLIVQLILSSCFFEYFVIV